eukprot:CAMPEP_0184681924 /NCGR_PEP_ID=MMETSP0312-20130426/4902_1 /TAXON_ID=31354 /ORGANISM="Compsopogon coeruleus, Strain SAG 36.94" /LENGTH=412 /DNA_ID=CAMNT_0027133061 /DNA_START=837 /DNA_END=2078 /DNA_ORIENTATION=-
MMHLRLGRLPELHHIDSEYIVSLLRIRIWTFGERRNEVTHLWKKGKPDPKRFSRLRIVPTGRLGFHLDDYSTYHLQKSAFLRRTKEKGIAIEHGCNSRNGGVEGFYESTIVSSYKVVREKFQLSGVTRDAGAREGSNERENVHQEEELSGTSNVHSEEKMELRPNPNEDALLFSDLFQVDFPIPSPRLADLADFPPSLQESETAVYNRVLTRTKTVEFNLKVDEMLPRSKSAAFPGEFMDIETWDVSDDFVDPFERSDSIIDSISQNISRESSSPDMRRSDSGKRLLEREPSLSSLEDLWQKTFETGFQDDSSEGSKRARGSTGDEGKAGVSEGKKINPKKLPAARFCHICLRKDSAVKMARCANLHKGHAGKSSARSVLANLGGTSRPPRIPAQAGCVRTAAKTAHPMPGA